MRTLRDKTDEYKQRETKAKMNDWDLIKIKTSAQQRKQLAKLKGN